jgi:undecaprenyl-diphosphatase
MTYIHAIVLGVVEGVTEFLPISSTAHLVLTSRVMGLAQTEFLKSFEIAIQSGAIAAVLVVYFKKFLNSAILSRLVVAFVPTGVIGFLLYKFIKSFFIGNLSLTLWVLGIGGIMLIGFEKTVGKKTVPVQPIEQLDYVTCVLVGVCQALAVVPGVSRSAATIVGGMLRGISRETIVEFSFLLAVPTLLAATTLDIIKNPQVLYGSDSGLLAVGFVTAFILAFASIKIFLGYVRRHDFVPFGIYRVLIAGLFLWLI